MIPGRAARSGGRVVAAYVRARPGSTLFTGILLTTVLLAPARFHSAIGAGLGDGLIQYRVAEALVDEGWIALPPLGRESDPRIRPGVDGRLYTVFGPGQSILFAAALVLDRGFGWLSGGPAQTPGPGLFSTVANAVPHAATASLLLALLVRLGVGSTAALLAALAWAFGSMAWRYATLSFDLPLALLLSFGGLHLLFVGAGRTGVAAWLGAGLLFGLAALTRLPTLLFLGPVGIYVACELLRPRSGSESPLRSTLALGLGLLPGLTTILLLNRVRFGSPFDTGYTETAAAYAFDASFWESLPALIASPGRSILIFSPLLVPAFFGIRPMLRRRPREGWLILGIGLLNFAVFAGNRNWATPNSWGPRFQLPLVLFLTVPLGFALDVWTAPPRRTSLRLFRAGALSVALLQGVSLLAPLSPAGRIVSLYWRPAESQVVTALGHVLAVLGPRRVSELNLWWVGPHAADPGARALLVALIVAWLACLGAVLLAIRPGGPPAASGVPDPAP